MANFKYTLKSGTILQITTAPFEAAVALVEAVRKATKGEDPNAEVGDAVVMNPDVRKAIYGVFDTALYGTIRLSPAIFDDLKVGDQARGDYFEICARLIEANCKPFFLMTSSVSTSEPSKSTESPK